MIGAVAFRWGIEKDLPICCGDAIAYALCNTWDRFKACSLMRQ